LTRLDFPEPDAPSASSLAGVRLRRQHLAGLVASARPAEKDRGLSGFERLQTPPGRVRPGNRADLGRGAEVPVQPAAEQRAQMVLQSFLELRRRGEDVTPRGKRDAVRGLQPTIEKCGQPLLLFRSLDDKRGVGQVRHQRRLLLVE